MQLHINTYGVYVHIKDQMFEIRKKQEDGSWQKQLYSSKKVNQIILNQGTAISSAAVKLAIINNIDIVFTERDGTPLGRVWHSKLGSTTLIRKEQLITSMNKNGLKTIKEWIGNKIDNEINFIKKLKKHRKRHAEYLNEKIQRIETLNISLSNIEGDNTQEAAETIRGLEGTAGRLFFETLSYILPKEYQFNGRSSRPAKDPFNAFLNYAFGILYSKIEKSLIIAGLDPYIGYLHRDDYNMTSFVFDIIQTYRIYPIEIVFKLFSAKKVNQSHTDKITGGYSLNNEGKQLLVTAYNTFMDEETIRYKGRNQTRNNTIQSDAHNYANSLIKNTKNNNLINIDKIFEI